MFDGEYEVSLYPIPQQIDDEVIHAHHSERTGGRYDIVSLGHGI